MLLTCGRCGRDAFTESRAQFFDDPSEIAVRVCKHLRRGFREYGYYGHDTHLL
jgi:hypothetical protein